MEMNFQIKKVKKRLLIGSIGMAILWMGLGSYGSFNPLETGFYTSIGAALVWYFLSYFGIKWLLAKASKRVNFKD